jgi:alpha-N-arabinofuranosidase
MDDAYMVPNLSESASIDSEGRLVITIGNLSVSEDYPVETVINGFAGKKAAAEILKNEMHAMNTFENPDNVKTESHAVELKADGTLCFTVPACSVVKITVEE